MAGHRDTHAGASPHLLLQYDDHGGQSETTEETLILSRANLGRGKIFIRKKNY